MLVVTTEALPGYVIRSVFGEVHGVSARPRNKFVEGIKELDGSTNPRVAHALARARQDAVRLMVEAAAQRGANAVVAMRFDNREITAGWAEICAYGTAVFVAVEVSQDEAGRGRYHA